jgi:hypothetical protein
LPTDVANFFFFLAKFGTNSFLRIAGRIPPIPARLPFGESRAEFFLAKLRGEFFLAELRGERSAPPPTCRNATLYIFKRLLVASLAVFCYLSSIAVDRLLL